MLRNCHFSEITSHLKELYCARMLITSQGHNSQDQLRNINSIQLIKQDDEQSKKTSKTEQSTTINKVLSSLDEPDQEPHTILIQGSYGTGKTEMLQEISFKWAKDEHLKHSDVLFLLHLRDIFVHEMDSLFDFVYYFFEYNTKYKAIVTQFVYELLQDGGQSVTLLLDSYHEYPHHLQKNGFIAKILQRKVLPACNIMLTSRPYDALMKSKLNFKIIITDKYEIKSSYSTEERQLQAATLYKYFQSYPDIPYSYVQYYYIPLYMNILLVLYKEGIFLPKFTDFYTQFICRTINRYLRKREIKEVVKKLEDLQPPLSSIIKQLSKLAFNGLKMNQTVFSMVELKKECPSFEADLNTWSYLGILQNIDTKSFQFFHYSMQEYLAAYYISELPLDEILDLFRKQFWNQNYHRMFIFCIGQNEKCKSAFKIFCDENKAIMADINHKHLSDKSLTKCSYLYECIIEIDDKELKKRK